MLVRTYVSYGSMGYQVRLSKKGSYSANRYAYTGMMNFCPPSTILSNQSHQGAKVVTSQLEGPWRHYNCAVLLTEGMWRIDKVTWTEGMWRIEGRQGL